MALMCSNLQIHLISPSITKLPSTSASSSTSPISLFVPRRPALGRAKPRRLAAVARMGPDEEKLTRRNPLDFPVEWERPKPGRRPDIFPQFSPMKTPLPPPMPYDPPEEDEEEEEKKEEEEEDPEKEEEEKPQESRWFPFRMFS